MGNVNKIYLQELNIFKEVEKLVFTLKEEEHLVLN